MFYLVDTTITTRATARIDAPDLATAVASVKAGKGTGQTTDTTETRKGRVDPNQTQPKVAAINPPTQAEIAAMPVVAAPTA